VVSRRIPSYFSHFLLVAIFALLFAPADAQANVRRRGYLPSSTGIQPIRLENGINAPPYSMGDAVSGLAFSSDGRWLYSVMPLTGEFFVCDLSADGISPSSYPLGLNDAAGIVVIPDGLKAFVVLPTGSLVVVDLSGPTPAIVDTTATPALKAIAMAPDGAWVYLTTTAGDLLRVSTVTHQVVASMSAGLVPGVGLDISSDGTRAVVTGTSFGTGRVQRIDLVNWTLDGPDIPVGGDPRNVVITPDGTTALVADHNGRVLFIDLATANVTQTVTDLSALNGINAIDIEPNGLTAWFTDRVTSWIFSLDVATRVATIESTVSHADINGKFIGKPFFRNAGTPNVVDTDAELTTLGFGAEVIVWGSLTLNGPFTSGRTFRFNDTPQLTVSMGPAVTLTGVLRGDGFNLVGGGLLITTGSYTLGPVDVGGTTTTLHVEGTHAGDISVHSGAFVTGTGTVGKLTVGSGGTVAPGASSGPGILTAGDTTFQGGTLFAFINGTMPGLGYSQLNTTSTTFVSGASLVTSVAYPTGPGDTFTIVTNRAAGTFNLLPEGSTINLAGTAAFVRYTGGDGNDVTLSVHTAPTASALQNAATDEDVPYSGSITIGDDLTLPDNLLVTAASSNTALIPNVTVSATGAVRNLQASPNAGLSGNTTITVQVSDGNWFTERSFVLTVTPVNDLPFIAAIADRTIDHDTATGPIPFTVTDLDGFDGHTVTASSSNLLLVPNANMTIGGAGGSRTITIVPAAGQHGTATITVTVDDGGATYSRTFTLTVTGPPPPPAIIYYLAEGATGPFFDTDLLLANPNAVPAPVTLTFLLEGGGTITQSRTLAPTSRTTIAVDDVSGLEAAAFSTMVTSTEGHAIAVERTMRWGSGGYGAHTEKATDAGGTTWYFAEGAAGYFSTYLLLGNPQPTANNAHVTWLREGEAPLTRSYPMAANSRGTVDTRADAELLDRSFGATVVFDQPGVAERSMYFGTDPLWSGGHGAAGATSLSTRWDFAEGATGTYFTTFLLLANPGGSPAQVTLTFFPEGGTPVTSTFTLEAGRRMTRNIALEHPSLANAAVAMRVESTGPIVAERAQYWGVPEWIESHNSFGVTTPGRRWALAEGRVGAAAGADSAQTYILLLNPGTDAAAATLTFLRTDGTTIVKMVDVPAASRVTIGVTGPDGAAPELVNESFGTLIESTAPIIVERSLYSNANGVTWAAGTNATATALPEP
jgi:DNA-binding beta-propeller fold protein YncE